MKVTYKAGPNLEIEFEVAGQKEIFESMAQLQEILKHKCQKCDGTDGWKFVVRVVDDNKFYELKCLKTGCGATLGFGSHKTGGTIFPQRKDTEGEFRKSGGWLKWNPDTKTRE